MTTEAYMRKWVNKMTKVHLGHKTFEQTDAKERLRVMWLTVRQRAPTGAIPTAAIVGRAPMVMPELAPPNLPQSLVQHTNMNEKDALAVVVNTATAPMTVSDCKEAMRRRMGCDPRMRINTSNNTIKRHLQRHSKFKASW